MIELNLPAYQTFFDTVSMNDFWSTVKYFLFFFAPVMMIYVAFKILERIAPIIKNAIYPNEERRYYDDDDDDYYY